MTPAYAEYLKTNPTCDELSAILGPKWAIVRQTPRNLARYPKCITRTEYNAAKADALRLRTDMAV